MMKIEHVAVWAKDLEMLRLFYIDYFGAIANEKYINPTTNFSSYFLSFDAGARLEIMQMPTIPLSKNDPYDQFTGIVHFAFSVGSEEEVDNLTQRLARDGFEVVSDPRKTGDGYYESCVLDPEGNRIEITS